MCFIYTQRMQNTHVHPQLPPPLSASTQTSHHLDDASLSPSESPNQQAVACLKSLSQRTIQMHKSQYTFATH